MTFMPSPDKSSTAFLATLRRKIFAALLSPPLALAFLGGCQPIWNKTVKDGTPGEQKTCIVLALPDSGSFASISAKIKHGAREAQKNLQTRGKEIRIENINTESADWLSKLSALPESCAIVGGPIQDKSYVAAQRSGILEKRAFFSFMPTLQGRDEGQRAWRFFPSPQDQIDALIRFVTDDLNVRTYASLMPQDTYGRKMTQLLENSLSARHISLQKASYSPGSQSSWNAAVRELINPRIRDGQNNPIPQTTFEALFLPDSWKNIDALTNALASNGEDRLVLLGTTLWEQGLANRRIPRADKYALAVFPGAWNKNKAPEILKKSGADFWSALGYDFINFAANMNLHSRMPSPEIGKRAGAAASSITALAPISWNGNGKAMQQLYLFQISPSEPVPLDLNTFKTSRQHIQENAALRMQGIEQDEHTGTPASPAYYETPAGTPETTQDVLGSPAPVPAPQNRPALGTTPRPSYKLRLPEKRP